MLIVAAVIVRALSEAAKAVASPTSSGGAARLSIVASVSTCSRRSRPSDPDSDETLRRADSDDPAHDRGQRRRNTARRQGHGRAHHRPLRADRRRRGGGEERLRAARGQQQETMWFLVWGGRVLNAKRLTRQDLSSFGILGAVLLAMCFDWRNGPRGCSSPLATPPANGSRRVGPGFSKRSSGAARRPRDSASCCQVTADNRFVRMG
jgi:hypothetical protein